MAAGPSGDRPAGVTGAAPAAKAAKATKGTTAKSAKGAIATKAAKGPTATKMKGVIAVPGAAAVPAAVPVVAAPRPGRARHPSLAIGIDVGGSGIKAAAVDLGTGALASPRHRIRTPEPSSPATVLPIIRHLLDTVRSDVGRDDLPVGVCFPSVILEGRTMTAANVDADWIEYPALTALSNAAGGPVGLINDADAAGLAEMRYGVGRGETGVVLLLTLGTGVGSGLFVDGRLVPNTELGHMEIRGKDAEKRSASVQRVVRGIGWPEWAALLDEHLRAIDRILWPDLIILGGGVSKNAHRFVGRLKVRPRLVPAHLRGDAGIVGAALWGAKTAKVRLPPVRVAIPTSVPEEPPEEQPEEPPE
jgi:polyphosphate glucokinase